MINKAIGYGVPCGEFIKELRFPMGNEPISRWRIRETLLLNLTGSENITGPDQQIITGDIGLSQLFEPVGDSISKPDHIIIFPTLDDKKRWHRRGDTLDRILSRGAASVYLDTPFAPYNCYMDGNGIEVNPPYRSDGIGPPFTRNDPVLVPGIPRVMREWITRYGVFGLSGIAKLRPMLSEWQRLH